jgi:hypothetical protein
MPQLRLCMGLQVLPNDLIDRDTEESLALRLSATSRSAKESWKLKIFPWHEQYLRVVSYVG